MASAAEQMAANLELGHPRESQRASSAHHFHRRSFDRLPSGHLYSGARDRRQRPQRLYGTGGVGYRRHSVHVYWWRFGPDGDLCPRHHALYFGVYHRSADDLDGAGSRRTSKKRVRQGARKSTNTPVIGTVALALFQAYGLAASLEAGDLAHDPGLVFPRRRCNHPCGRHDVPDVAR